MLCPNFSLSTSFQTSRAHPGPPSYEFKGFIARLQRENVTHYVCYFMVTNKDLDEYRKSGIQVGDFDQSKRWRKFNDGRIDGWFSWKDVVKDCVEDRILPTILFF